MRRRRRVLTGNTPPLKEETPLKEEETPLKEEEIPMKEEINVNDETSKNEEITVKDNVKDTVKDNVPLELLTDMVYLGKKANDYLSKNRITPLNDETSKNEEITVSQRNSFRKLEEKVDELKKDLSKANNKITELIFNSNKFLICIISCEKNREHKEWIKKSWLNSLKNNKNIDYLFIYGHPDMENEYEINNDELHLKCDDGYFKLNEKMTCLWRYLSRVHKEYNRYLKIDDDTFVNVPKLKDYLSEIISREINYFGAIMYKYTIGIWNNLPNGSYEGPIYSGPFYGMSKEVIDYYVENITNESIENNRCEDKLFADTVRDKYHVFNHFPKESIEISKNINFICFEDRNKDYSNQTIIHNIKSLDDFLYISQLKEEITVGERNSFRKLEERIEELEKNLSLLNNNIIEEYNKLHDIKNIDIESDNFVKESYLNNKEKLRQLDIIKLDQIIQRDFYNVSVYNINKFIILIPYCDVYSDYIDECINSVFQQYYDNYEIIIVNDGGNSDCLNKYIQNSKITLLNFKTNNGPAFSKWKFIEYIQKNMDNYNKNDICLILDGDDYLLENALEIINETYILNKCWVTFGDCSGCFTSKNREYYNKATDYSKIRNSNWFANHPRTMKLFLLLEMKIIDFQFNNKWMKKCSDRLIVYKGFELSGKNRISYIKDVVYYYREHNLNSYKTFRGNKQELLDHCNNSEKCNTLIEDIHIILCCWKRYQNLDAQANMLNNQTMSKRIHLHLVNNNYDGKEELEEIVEECKSKYRNIKISLSHYHNEYFGFMRFLYIRDILLKKYIIDYVIIIDDDQLYSNDWIEKMWELRKPKIYTSWYCKKWKENFDYWKGSVIDYKDCIKNERKDIEYTDYNGTGGSLIDVSIFYNNSPLWNIPDDIPEGVSVYNIEDLYLSFISKNDLGYSLKRSFLPEEKSLNDDNQSNEVSLWCELGDNKQLLLDYLVNKYLK